MKPVHLVIIFFLFVCFDSGKQAVNYKIHRFRPQAFCKCDVEHGEEDYQQPQAWTHWSLRMGRQIDVRYVRDNKAGRCQKQQLR